MLSDRGVAHVLNSWTKMPPIIEQIQIAGVLSAGFSVARALLRPGRTYQEAVEMFQPYETIKEENPEIRLGLAESVRRCVAEGKQLYAYVNNRAEGNSPKTIEAILDILGHISRRDPVSRNTPELHEEIHAQEITLQGRPRRPEPPQHFRIDYRNQLNPAQYQAVSSVNGPHLIIAGAGTGKTRTITYRVAYLVELGVKPESILLLTFTRRAAQEMLRRASILLDARCEKVAGGTFHSFANLVLRQYAPLLDFDSSFSILDQGDAEDVVNLLRTQLKFDTKERRFPRKQTLYDHLLPCRQYR